MTKTKKISTKDLTLIALMTGITVIMAQITIPMPYGVPMTMQTFAVTLAGVILGSKKGFSSMLLYILLGMIGLPVFAGFTGGFGKFLGPTGGFLFSFPIMAFIIGYGTKYIKNKLVFATFLIIGTLSNFAVGVPWFSFMTGTPILASISMVFIPFIPTSIIKGLIAWFIGVKIRTQIKINN